eukprot:XP_011617350.1 PREDICTED: basement membrane-specific heparan sulfate proteoglycan core protein [Takifugu rubripes]
MGLLALLLIKSGLVLRFLALRISMTSKNGRGTLTIRDVKEADQGAYTCEAINAKGLVFGIPDGVLTLTSTSNPGNCPEGHFTVEGRCVSCFCAGIAKNCKNTGRYRNHVSLRFTAEDDFKGVNVSYPSRPGIPPLSSTQLLINPEMEEFQLVDLSHRFLSLDSFWTLPRQFLGNKIDSYGGSLRYKVRYTLARGMSEAVERPDVVLVGNGRRLVYRRGSSTPARVLHQKDIKFTEDNWQHSNGRAVTREDLMMTLASLDSISIRTVYDNHMVSAALSDVSMDTTTVEFSILGHAKNVEECRCPPGYYGLSCEACSPGFERVPGGSYLGTCAGCHCNGHASACDPVNGHCLSCQHHTEGPRCDKCRSGYFGDPSRGRPDDCKPCPCPYYETTRRFSDTCFLDVDNQPTCDACRLGYTGRRCEKCAPGYHGNPIAPNGKCVPNERSTCDSRGVVSSSSSPCSCKNNVAGARCDECKPGFFHLSGANPDGCLRCFCMGVTKQCASATWSRDQVRGAVNGQLFSLSNSGNTKTFNEGISQRGSSEVVYSSFSSLPSDVYYWVLPESFRGDKVTAYGGELQYTVRFSPSQRPLKVGGQPDVVLQGNGILLEHYSETRPTAHAPQTFSVTFRESAWRRADGQACTREHLLMALADISVFMIRASYVVNMAESSIADIKMDVAVPESIGSGAALEVEQCACPQGYRGPSCQECDDGYTRSSSGLYLGTCERCSCHGHASSCDPETGSCQNCLHNTAGPRCERCQSGYYGNPVTGGAQACQRCPCPGTASSNQFSSTCYQDSDGGPTCDSCPPGYAGRRCERCAPGYSGNPLLGQRCTVGGNEVNGNCYSCDPRGSEGCHNGGACRCKMNVEGPTCTSCKPGNFHLSSGNKDGCLSCFCMGVTQQCFSSAYYRDVVSSAFSPGNFQGFALVNQQRTNRISTGFTVEVSTEGTQLSYSNFDDQEPHYWQLSEAYQGDKVGSYGGKLKFTISYVAGPRGTVLDDGDVQIIGNDITLVARQSWQGRQQGGRETRRFEVVFREENWRRPDGMPATREHLMMVLADLDDILIRASYSTEMRSSSISDVSLEVAVPNYSGLAPALEVEQCRCPPGYQGLSCQDCAPGYTRTGGGLYLGHCELCECNGHSDSCHPETGICTSCLHNTQGELCEQCAPGFFGDPTVGTPEDCQPCACPHTDPDNQFSPTCESLGNGGYQCTACQPGYTGQYCERCAPGYVGNPQDRVKCRPYDAAASLVVKVYPERVLTSQNSAVTLRCQVSGAPPHYYYWSREDGRLISGSAERRRQGAELFFPSVQASDAGVYVCTCRDQRGTNRSRAEIVVTNVQSKAIEVTVEEPKAQSVRVGSTVSFICTAKSKSPAYTLVWTRMGNGKLPNRAMDFNGILTIQNVQPEDAGMYVCTGSNMLAMDEGSAILYVPEASQTRMFYTAYEMFEGHRKPGDGAQPVAAASPTVLSVQQGQRAEFRCTATGNPTPAIEWTGGPGNKMSPRALIRGGVLAFASVDAADQGEYSCKALNTHGEHTARVALVVHKPGPSGPGTQPQVQVSPQNIEVHEGDTLRLYCRATGSPTPKLRWLKNGGQMPPQAVPSHGFHQFKSNSLDVLQRRNEQQQIRTDIGTLLIPDVTVSDSGTYMCVGSNSIGSNSAPIKVVVLKADQSSSVVTIQPSIAEVQEGQSLDLNCVTSGNPPPRVTWSRASGRLSSNHQVLGNQLRILSATPEDSGEYVCRVQGSHGNPSSHLRQATVSVSVTSSSSRLQSPIIAIEPHSAVVRVGETATFRCRVYSGAQPVRLEWKVANSQHLPDNVKLSRDGSVITIVNVQPDNHGTFRCVASNPFGITHTIVSLIVKDSPVAVVTPAGPVRVKVGEPINLECQASGDPRPSVSWHRLDSNRKIMLTSPVPMETNAVMQILAARPEDSGTYVCTARSSGGSTEARVEVSVEGQPRASVDQPQMVVVEGRTATLRCHVNGFPAPVITWSKLRSPLPWGHKVVNNSLVLPNVGRQDSGEYICRATNSIGSSQVTIKLDVETLPYATLLPDNVAVRVGEVIRLQCLAHGTPPLTYSWTRLDGSVCVFCYLLCLSCFHMFTFTASRVLPPLPHLSWWEGLILYAGMILYNGQKRSTGADFISLGLVGGRLEFRFDVGSGMATIRDPNPIKLGEFHTVELHRNHTLGYILVDGGEPVNGSSQGKFQGLDLNEELHVGGYPNYTLLAKTAGIKTGFVGCIRQLVIQGEEVIFKDLHRNSTGVTNCPTCKDRPCQNGGACEDSEASLYKCSCPRGFTGSNCQHHSSLHCHSEACGPDATCINRPNGLGYDCRCHLGKSGNKCMEGELVTTPLFDGEESYIAYPPLTNIHDDLRVQLEFKPLERDGLMFFCGGKKMKVEDFVSISMVDGHVEFRYELGTGQAVLLSPEPVSLGQWHTVVAERNKRAGHLRVDQGPTERKSSPGKAQGLNVHTPMYLGGVPNMDILPKPANVSELFEGCVGEVSINNKKVDLSYSFRESRAVRQCVDASPCDRRPCLNGGQCLSSAEYEYQCLCQDGYEGERCEVLKYVCQTNRQCQNGGICVEGVCVCPPAYTGQTCGEGLSKTQWDSEASEANDSPYQFEAHFHKDGYIALPKSIFPRSAHDSPETIELEISTDSSDGLILWQGVETNGARHLRKVHASKKELGEHGRGKDFISLGLQRGHLVFSYQLGSGEAQILSREAVNDGRWHKVTAVRTGKDGYIQIDGGAAVHGQSRGRSIMVNTKGNVYLGGAPDTAAMTGGKFSVGLAGCMRNLVLMNARPGQQPAPTVDLQAYAAHAINVQPCSS